MSLFISAPTCLPPSPFLYQRATGKQLITSESSLHRPQQLSQRRTRLRQGAAQNDYQRDEGVVDDWLHAANHRSAKLSKCGTAEAEQQCKPQTRIPGKRCKQEREAPFHTRTPLRGPA